MKTQRRDERTGRWLRAPRCECPSCGCAERATTEDDGGNRVCEACASYAVDDDGETYCSRCAEYEDAGEWTGGGMHGLGTGWVSRPRVRVRPEGGVS